MITLYYAPDNASLIVRILLEELALPYQAILVDRSTQDQTTDEYLKLNPNGLIPVCIIDDQPVFETAAIVLTLADKHNKFAIAPEDIQRPQFLKWLFFLSNSLHADLRQCFYPTQYVGSESGALELFNATTYKRIVARLGILEAQYAAVDSDYLFGAKPTIVDIYLAVCMRWLQLYPVASERHINPADFPFLEKMLLKLEQRKALANACHKEGITGMFFSAATYADPPEGVAL